MGCKWQVELCESNSVKNGGITIAQPNPEEFAVLLCHIAEIETLYLGPDLHRRAKFGADNTWAGQWLAP